MSDWVFEILTVVAVLVAAFALKTFQQAAVRKAGALLILTASYLTGYFLTDSHYGGGAGILIWFVLPLFPLLTRVRQMRLPVEKTLEKCTPPSVNRFPTLNEFTEEIEAQDFEYVADKGWQWDDSKQYFRLFYNAEEKQQAVICLNEQEEMSFAFVSIVCRTKYGQTYRTWNYPFSYTMKTAPGVVMNAVPNVDGFEGLIAAHREFLIKSQVNPDEILVEDEKSFDQAMEEELRLQVRHNLDSGLIALAGEGTFRYSWRGLFFLWGQFVKDMVKLS
ncbi:MAG: hypothetical protein QM496_09580 [Verrucomicrobiota bacterium]